MSNIQITQTETPNIVVTVDRGVAGVGIESISVVYNAPTYYLDFLYTDGTNELVALPELASGVASFNGRAGIVTLTSLDVTTALGYTPPTPTGTGATGTWTISINGNASTVTNGVYTTDTGTVTNAMLAGSIANAKLVNSAITINGSPTSLGGSINVGTVTSVSGTAPITSTGGATPSIGMPQATTAQDGYLSAVDWDTFNDKTNNLGTVTSVSGTGNVNGITLTGNITDSGILTLGGSLSSVNLVTQTVGSLDVATRATGILPIANGGTNASTAPTARTNLGLGTSAVLNAAVALGTATLDSGGTVPLTQLPASIKAGLVYKGTWNASTNTPTLTSSVGTANDYYVVSVAGTTNLNGVNVWAVNDLAIFSGTVWQKVSASNPTIITANSTTPALTVTQTGTGNALVVEDSASDTTPFVIDSNGNVSVGGTLTAGGFLVVDQTDIGTAPNEIPLNQYLGNLAYQDAANIAGNVGVGGSVTATSGVINANNTTNALRITQTGAGNALLIEDSASPDSTPFVIDQVGRVVAGYTASILSPDLVGNQVTAPLLTIAGSDTYSASSAIDYFANTSSGGSTFSLNKSRSSTVGSHTVVASGDTLGAVQWSGSDGTNFIRAASITAAVDGTPGTGDMPGRLVFSTTADGASSPTERMRIDNRGAVGIGTAAITATAFRLGTTITGGTTAYGAFWGSTIQPTVTATGIYNATSAATAANGGTPWTLFALRHYQAAQGTFNADSTVTNQYGFEAASTLTSATNNFGFYSNIASGTGRWNFYANGTADNYFAGSVGIGATANASAILDVQSTTKGVRMPNMTTTQKNAIATPAAGLMVFDTTLSKLSVYTGAAWETITSI